MPKTIYCWRCRVDMPMLAEDEWQRVSSLMGNLVADVRRHRLESACGLAEAMAVAGRPALDAYEEITGFRETNVQALHHHRLNLYGPPCGQCGKPLRTPQARFCAMCDWERADCSPWSPDADDLKN